MGVAASWSQGDRGERKGSQTQTKHNTKETLDGCPISAAGVLQAGRRTPGAITQGRVMAAGQQSVAATCPSSEELLKATC